jgi:hypothetical protein
MWKYSDLLVQMSNFPSSLWQSYTTGLELKFVLINWLIIISQSDKILRHQDDSYFAYSRIKLHTSVVW